MRGNKGFVKLHFDSTFEEGAILVFERRICSLNEALQAPKNLFTTNGKNRVIDELLQAI